MADPYSTLIAQKQMELDRLKAQSFSQPAPATQTPHPLPDIAAMVKAEMDKYLPQIQAAKAVPAMDWKAIASHLLKKALTGEDLEYIQKHIAEGAPGCLPFLESSTIVTLIQMAYQEYRSFLAGKVK